MTSTGVKEAAFLVVVGKTFEVASERLGRNGEKDTGNVKSTCTYIEIQDYGSA
jgi:hypothetical protein